MNQIFKYKETVQLYHVDGASMLFYGQLFFILHNAFAAFLKKHNFSIRDRLVKQDFFFPVVHTEANYSKSVFVGDEIDIDLFIERIGTTSFTVAYHLSSKGVSIGDAKIVHAGIDAKSKTKIELPIEFKSVLEEFLREEKPCSI